MYNINTYYYIYYYIMVGKSLPTVAIHSSDSSNFRNWSCTAQDRHELSGPQGEVDAFQDLSSKKKTVFYPLVN